MRKPLPGFCGKRFLTTYLTITGFGAHGDSGDKSFKEQLFRNERCQKGAEIVRKKFPEFFGIMMPRVRVSPLGPKVQNPLLRSLGFFSSLHKNSLSEKSYLVAVLCATRILLLRDSRKRDRLVVK